MKKTSEEISSDYIRLPKPKTRCAYTGLSRTSLAELVVPCERNGYRPVVTSRVVKSNPHAIRGIRLISRESLTAYLLNLSP